MPRRPRLAAGDLAYHILNRRVGRLPLFESPQDYAAFEQILAEAHEQTGIRLTAYALMPNHWHLLMWPRHDGELSEVMRWITVTHSQRWHAAHKTSGTGPVYQGRFKSFPVQTDEHFLTVARYVERNAVRAKLVTRADEWLWSSAGKRARDAAGGKTTPWLSEWPVERPRDWSAQLNRAQATADVEAVRVSVQRGRPFGDDAWIRRMVKKFGMESTMRGPGRPKGS